MNILDPNTKSLATSLLKQFEFVFERITALEVDVHLKERLLTNVKDLAALGKITPEEVLSDLMLNSSKLEALNIKYMERIVSSETLKKESPPSKRAYVPLGRPAQLITAVKASAAKISDLLGITERKPDERSDK